MKIKSLYTLFILFSLILGSCNPYKGFKGVDKKGMKKNKPPSQELREDYEKMNKRSSKAYKKEQKRRKKRLGTNESSTPG